MLSCTSIVGVVASVTALACRIAKAYFQWADIQKLKGYGWFPICIRSIQRKNVRISFSCLSRRPFGLAFSFFQFSLFDFLLCCWTEMQILYTLHYILNIQWISRWLSNVYLSLKCKFIEHEIGFMFILSIFFTSGYQIHILGIWKKYRRSSGVTKKKKEWHTHIKSIIILR